MGVVPVAKAGIGSAANDATRELGGTLGVAVIGSVALSLYREQLGDATLGPATEQAAQESLGAAAVAAQQTGDPSLLDHLAQQGFLDGLSARLLRRRRVGLVGALLTARYLPSHPPDHATELPRASAVPAQETFP
jgi:hypothetical protein